MSIQFLEHRRLRYRAGHLEYIIAEGEDDSVGSRAGKLGPGDTWPDDDRRFHAQPVGAAAGAEEGLNNLKPRDEVFRIPGTTPQYPRDSEYLIPGLAISIPNAIPSLFNLPLMRSQLKV